MRKAWCLRFVALISRTACVSDGYFEYCHGLHAKLYGQNNRALCLKTADDSIVDNIIVQDVITEDDYERVIKP